MSETFDPLRQRALLDREVEAPIPDVDALMTEGRRATRWSSEPLDTVEAWMRGRKTPAAADVVSAFLIGWRLGGGTPSPSLSEALIDLVEKLGFESLGPAAANTTVLALAPVPEEVGGPLAERAKRILREADRRREVLGLQAGARAALNELFREGAFPLR